MRTGRIPVLLLLAIGVMALCSVSIAYAADKENLLALYDQEWNLRYYMKGNAVYGTDWHLRYYVRKDEMYDLNWQRQYFIRDAEVYDTDQHLQYRIKEFPTNMPAGAQDGKE